MQDDYNEDDFECPKCGHSPIRSGTCTEITCEDGYIDESEEDYMVEGSVMIRCDECKGTGIIRWCPSCGAELTGVHFKNDDY